MAFLDNRKLFFFNERGEDANFVLQDGVYRGVFFMPLISTYLINNLNFFIYEQFDVSGSIEYGQPQDIALVTNETIFKIVYSDKEDKRWSFYDFEEVQQLKVFTESQTQFGSTDATNRTTGNANGISTTNAVDPDGIKIKSAFSSGDEGSFRNSIMIYAVSPDTNEEELVANIDLYTEVEEEDQRLGTIINNFYKDVQIDQQDFFIFRDTDIKEGYPDWTVINSKFKELLLNGRDLKNFQGSYRGLITAIRYFGYDSLRIQEYFKNVDTESKDFDKLKFKVIKEQFDGVIDPFYVDSEPMPNKIWKKTSQFGLAYDINRVVEGEYDEYGLPIVEDAFDFTNEEILIKLQGLKEKLKSKFLPLSARIISVTGEGSYFTKYDINSWNEMNVSDNINVGRAAEFELSPQPCGFIINLNELLIELDSIVRQDKNLVVPTTDTVYYNTTWNNVIPLTNTAVEIISVIINSNDFFVKGVDYILNGPKTDILWISTSFDLSDNDEIFIEYTYSALDTPLEDWNPNPTVPYNKLKEHIVDQTIILGTPYTQTFLEFLINKIESPSELNDDEDIPVGCPLTLTNTTFELTWDEMAIDWELADEGVNGSMNTWDTIKYESYYEIEWIIEKRVDDNSPLEWLYELRGNIAQYETINLILPYSGTYDIKMRLYNTFNSSTSETTILEVEQKNADTVINHKAFRTDFTWDDVDREWDNTWYTWSVNLEGDLLWDDSNVTWDKVDKAKYSNSRHYNNLYNFTLNDISNAIWDQLDHLWWDGTNDAILYNPYTWNHIGIKTWEHFYKNETWDGNVLASDSPAFFEILSVDSTSSSITIGDLVPKTYEVTVNNPLLGPQTSTHLYKYNFIRFTNPSNHPEGNLISIIDSPGQTLLNITRDSNNYMSDIDGIPIERGNLVFLSVTYAGNNILIDQPISEESISMFVNGIELIEGVDYTINPAGDTVVFTPPVSFGDLIEYTYYSPEERVNTIDYTTNFNNLSNTGTNVLEINDSGFLSNIQIGQTINLLIPTQSGSTAIVRTITDINGINIIYSGSPRNSITKLENPNTIIEEIITSDYPEIKESSWKIINDKLALFETDLRSDEIERQIYAVDGDKLLLSTAATDLEVAYNEIVNSNLYHFNRFNWNIVYEEDEVTVNRIQAISKLFGESQISNIEYEEVTGDIYAPAVTLNYNWSELRVFETRKTIPQFSQMIMSYDNSKMPGKQETATWELTEVESGTIYNLTENVFSHFFDRRGEYILKLVLSDSNGNLKECLKQGIVLVE